MIRPTTKHQRTKAQKRQENTAALLNLGWVSKVEGKWFRPGSKYTYDFDVAVGLAHLNGTLGPRGQNLKLKKTGGKDQPRVNNKFGKKKLKQDLTDEKCA